MNVSVLIAGIGNIFNGDDAFGVEVIHRLAGFNLPENVRLMDIGIRSIDLAFALFEEYDLTILVDAITRGKAPGTLYTIQIGPDDIPDASDEKCLVNSHALDPVRVLALAKTMGSRFKDILLVGCEPLVLEQDESGHIGLSEVVGAAVNPAVETVRRLVEDFTRGNALRHFLDEERVCTHELI
jgi:hydrogenase maturation protease